jgi:hypothetical protein
MHFLVYAILSLPWDAFHAVPGIERLVVSTSRNSTHNGHAATSWSGKQRLWTRGRDAEGTAWGLYRLGTRFVQGCRLAPTD